MAWTPPPQPTALNTPVEDVLFLDIETVPSYPSIDNLPSEGMKVFLKKFTNETAQHLKDNQPVTKEIIDAFYEHLWQTKAALFCEYNKIVCVSLGVMPPGREGTFRVKAIFGEDEREIIKALTPTLGKAKFLCAHNGKGFDFPMLARKYIQYGLDIPSIISVWGLKPWETKLFDTMEMWGMNVFNDRVSLDALAFLFGLPSPKKEISGGTVGAVYYSSPDDDALPWEYEDRLKKIAEYCNGDVVTLANVYLRMINKPPIIEGKIVSV